MTQPEIRARGPTRRATLLMLGATALAACRHGKPFHSVDVTGALPALDFTLTRASDGRTVTQADYRGALVMLFFGYTHCPDVCPLTMGNLAQVLDRMGDGARDIRVLFVTVDPNRDTPGVLARYSAQFGPGVEALRGTDNQLADVTRRYRVTYKVTPPHGSQPYRVIHGPSVYVFGPRGRARLLIPRLYDAGADVAGVTEDMTRLVKGA
ncbi:SCO family protein [Acidimangrovimonas sediminis]|uniref:SCO family protein n=1 Tax=Acidimangrovimonas sediminis TaxID=2056283 RepID=UPI001304D134|nr:SCO family protein [Acidimangrovimonas sediminis]